MRRGNSASRASFRVVWDEVNLDLLEHEKTPKQKIDEPKTPYHAPQADGTLSPIPDETKSSVDAAVHADALRHALQGVASSSNDQRLGEGQCGSSSSCGRRKSFEDIRREHYAEFKTVKELMPQMEDEDDEDLDRSQLAGGVGGIKIEENRASSSKSS